MLLLAGGATLAVGANGDDNSSGKTYELLFDNAFGLTEGGDFKVAGVRAGQTSSFGITKVDGRPLALVTAEVTEPGLADLRKDARCEIRPQSLIGEYFVDCQPGTADEQLPDGGRVPVEQTSSTIAIDLVNDIMRRPYRERFRLIIGELGAGLAGRPEDLSNVLRRAHPALRETSETLRILGRQTGTIEQFIGDAETVIAALEDRKQDVSRFVREAGNTAAVSASRREELAETFRRLPAFLGELEPYMGRLGDLTEAQTPVLRDLQSASGELDTFLTRLRPFAAEGIPAFEALGEMSVVGRRAVRKTTEEVRELRRLGKDAPALAKPLRQFLQTIDDRDRAVEPDPRAAATDPPARRQDPHHLPPRRLHRHGGGLELLLLAGAQHERARRHRPRAAAPHRRQRVLGLHDQPERRAARGVQPVPRPDTAGRDHPRPDRGRRRRRGGLPAGRMRRAGRQLGASPVLIGAVTVLVAIVAVFISYSANTGPAVRADLPAQGGGAERRQAREGQRGARRRLPGRDRRGDHERAPHRGRRGARDRPARPEARQDDRAAVGGLDPVACARAPRSASSTWS